MCNIVHDLFNENKLFCLHIVSTSSMCVFLTLSTRAKQAANLVFLFTFPLCETFLELKAKRDISHNIGYRTGKRVSSNRLRGRF